MRIALYGDSYGVSEEPLDTSWFSILSNRLDYPIDNYSVSGSSLYGSYVKFLETYDRYDLIIFLVTDPNRYPIEVDFSEAVPKGLRHVSSLGMIDYIRQDVNHLLSNLDIQLLNDVEGWYKASNEQFSKTVHHLLVEKIGSMHSNLIFYPCFPTSLDSEMMNDAGIDIKHTLFNLFIDQLTKLEFARTLESVLYAGSHENAKVISGHLTPEFNAFVANLMYTKISTGNWNYDGYDKITLLHAKEHYYL